MKRNTVAPTIIKLPAMKVAWSAVAPSVDASKSGAPASVAVAEAHSINWKHPKVASFKPLADFKK